jgi:magnesium transporter
MRARIFDADRIRTTTEPSDVSAAIADGTPVWIDLERRSPDTDALLRDVLNLHPTTVEDVWSDRMTPKVERFDGYLYMLVQAIAGLEGHAPRLAELDVVLGPGWIVSHDDSRVVSEEVAAEVDRAPRLLGKGPAWIAHALLDRAVERWVPVLETLDAALESLEAEVLETAGTPRGKSTLLRLLDFKRALWSLRRTGVRQRETLFRLSREEFAQIPAEALPFFRDIHDHFLDLADMAAGYPDRAGAAFDAYVSVQSARMNEVMKTLTLISTIMLPLTFIAGLYGMNFQFMPELSWKYGYFAALAVMALLAVGIVAAFRRRGWLGRDF